MRTTWRRHNPKKRRAGTLGLSLMIMAGLLAAIPVLASAKDPINYTIVFDHGGGATTTISGQSSDNNAFIADAGGTDKDNPIGMTMHVSCSDDFPGGWGEKEGPDPSRDSAWRVKSISIDKGKKTCTQGDPIPPPRPAVDIEKATNGHDADDPTGPEIPVGDGVTWTYVVTNTGTTELRNVRVLDYVPVVGSGTPTAIDCPEDTLDVGESMTCEAFGTAELGQYANEAKVLAEGDIGTSTAIDGKKKQYTFIFEHTDGRTTRIDGSSEKNEAFLPNAGGNSTTPSGMTVHVSCSDKFIGGWGQKGSPSPGADSEWKIQSFYIREVKDGSIKKSCGSPLPETVTVMDQDPSHYFGVGGDPDIDIEKATNGHDADRPSDGPTLSEGDDVTWTYVVTNTGSVDLFDVEVEDDEEGFIGFVDFLAVGDSTTFEKTGTVGSHNYSNEGCVVGVDENGNEVDDCDPSHYKVREYGRQASIDLEKATNGEDADHPTGPRVPVGDRVTWTYEVTNDGDKNLYAVFVYDEKEGRVDCPQRNLDPGESMTCTLSGRARHGQYANEAWVTAWTDSGMVRDYDWSHYLGVAGHGYGNQADIDIEKATNGHDADHPGGPNITVGDDVEWTYVVTNTGDETLYGVYVYDEEEGHVDCPQRTLAAGETMTCTLWGEAYEGRYSNEAWVTGWGDDGMVRDRDSSHYTGVW